MSLDEMLKNKCTLPPPTVYCCDNWEDSSTINVHAELDIVDKATGIREDDSWKNYPDTYQGRLCVNRYLALQAAQRKSKAELATYNIIREWIDFLLRSHESLYLQEYRTNDKAFYCRRSLRPLPRGKWPEVWKARLKWLKHPEDLTIPELELALVVFKWDTDAPELNQFLNTFPYMLRSVHSYLLHRYSFGLVSHLTKAMKSAKGAGDVQKKAGKYGTEKNHLDRVPYVAGMGWKCYPRMGGMTALGFLALLGAEPFSTFFFGAEWKAVAGCGALVAVALSLLTTIDIMGQSQGFFERKNHALPRTLGTLLRMAVWSCLIGVIAVLVIWGMRPEIVDPFARNFIWYDAEQNPLSNVVLPLVDIGCPVDWGMTAQLIIRWLALSISAAGVGALLQWFWEDKAMTDPI